MCGNGSFCPRSSVDACTLEMERGLGVRVPKLVCCAVTCVRFSGVLAVFESDAGLIKVVGVDAQKPLPQVLLPQAQEALPRRTAVTGFVCCVIASGFACVGHIEGARERNHLSIMNPSSLPPPLSLPPSIPSSLPIISSLDICHNPMRRWCSPARRQFAT